MTPTGKALAYLNERGIPADVVERWIPRTFITKDFLGFADVIYLRNGIVALQVTGNTNHAARRTKILAEERARQWLQNGGRIQVWSFKKNKAYPRIENILLSHFSPTACTNGSHSDSGQSKSGLTCTVRQT